MTTLRLESFGGLVPRVSPRALPADAAQRYENLLATSTELRPLAGDKTVAPAPPGALTLYRLSRNPDGTLRTDDGAGWITAAEDKNHVKGQLNDDATERTVVTFNDGTQPPRIIDVTGADRLLGVPAPAALGVTANEVGQFTMDDALTWVADELQPALAEALLSSLLHDEVGSRFTGNVPVAGTTEAHGMTHYTAVPWYAVYTMPRATADARGLTGGEVGRVDLSGGQAGFIIETGPYWGRVTDMAGFKAKLAAIELPDGGAAFDSAQVDKLADTLAKLFDPEGASLKARRKEMDSIAQKFVSALAGAAALPADSRPAEPVKPSEPEFKWTFIGGDEGWGMVRSPAWEAYDADLVQYRRDLADWEREQGEATTAAIGATARIHRLRQECEALSNEIEAEYFRRRDNIIDLVASALAGHNLLGGEDAMIQVDPDRIIDTRFYVATYVTDWGEESAPSPVSDMVEIDQNDSVTVTIPAPPPGRHIEKWRLYRSNVGTQTATFQFVEELLVSTPTYTDDLRGEQLGEPCPTLTWAEPPVRINSGSAASIKPPKGSDPYLRGAVAMPNGIIAGFIDNFVAFCHPYHVYAWPVEYQITTEFPIVGLGVFGQTLFVGTRGNPYLISGADSASMSAVKLDSEHACVSRRSIASAGNGVIYASPDGLCLATHNGVEVLTSALFSREDWQALNPSSITAIVHEGVYYFWTATACWALDFAAKKLGTVTGAPATAVHRDTLTDHLYAVVGGDVRKLFSAGRRTATWKSGVAQLPAQAPLAWLQVDSRFEAGPVVVTWMGDGAQRHQVSVDSITPRRLPPGRWLEHEVVVESASRVTKVMLAGSGAELRGS